ncbi:MAG: hypothetical protein HY282_18780 [Nitrospirae bacterium]|nr:hypothetical protein [Candidatus Manganitrophaceae bacterium]
MDQKDCLGGDLHHLPSFLLAGEGVGSRKLVGLRLWLALGGGGVGVCAA